MNSNSAKTRLQVGTSANRMVMGGQLAEQTLRNLKRTDILETLAMNKAPGAEPLILFHGPYYDGLAALFDTGDLFLALESVNPRERHPAMMGMYCSWITPEKAPAVKNDSETLASTREDRARSAGTLPAMMTLPERLRSPRPRKSATG